MSHAQAAQRPSGAPADAAAPPPSFSRPGSTAPADAASWAADTAASAVFEYIEPLAPAYRQLIAASDCPNRRARSSDRRGEPAGRPLAGSMCRNPAVSQSPAPDVSAIESVRTAGSRPETALLPSRASYSSPSSDMVAMRSCPRAGQGSGSAPLPPLHALTTSASWTHCLPTSLFGGAGGSKTTSAPAPWQRLAMSRAPAVALSK